MTQLDGFPNRNAHTVLEDDAALSGRTTSWPQIANTFVRTEDKYLVPCGLYKFFVEQLQERMPPSYPVPGTSYTFIESRYYDSAQLQFFQDHFRSLPLRFKLRTRRYGPNGNWQSDLLHLELKSKQQKVSRKERFCIAETDLQPLSNGGLLALTSSLKEMNQRMKQKTLSERVEKVNIIVAEIAPRPVCTVRYVRRAFEQDGIRVTVDNSLRSELISCPSSGTISEICEGPFWNKMQRLAHKIRDDSHFILEVKHTAPTPDWLEELVQTYELKDTGFSKYCYSILNLIFMSGGAL